MNKRVLTIFMLILFYVINLESQNKVEYYFDFEHMNIKKDSMYQRWIIKNENAVFQDIEPYFIGTTVNGGPHSYSSVEYKNYDVGEKWLHHSPTWFINNSHVGRSYNHIEMILKTPLPKNKYYSISFLIGNIKSHRYKPSHYGVKFSSTKIKKNKIGGLLSKPDIFFSFEEDNELIPIKGIYYASKDIKYIYFGIFKEDTVILKKDFIVPQLLLAMHNGKVDSFPITKPTRVILDNLKIRELDKVNKKFKDIYFEHDRSETNDKKSIENIKIIFRYLLKHPKTQLFIYGYTDEIGSLEYNLELSNRRAKFIKKEIALLGISKDRLVTIGKGILKRNKIHEKNKNARKVSFIVFE